jgi:hypothetical protein
MSVSAASSIKSVDLAESLSPRLPSENATTAETAGLGHLQMFEGDTPSFSDFLDIINPLQHIPVVNDIYREITGDKIGVGARLAGGTLYGGPIGLIGSAINAVIEEATGHDIGGHVIALFKDDTAPSSTGTALASATVPNPVASAAANSNEPPVTAQSVTSASAKDDSGRTAAKPMLLPDLTDSGQLALAQSAAMSAPAPASTPVIANTGTKAEPPLPAAAPQAPVAASEGAQTKPEGKPMPLWGGREPRAMPVPARNTPLATRSPPALGMSTSSTSTRSNTPIVGARTYQPPVSPAMVQEMAQTQAANQAGSAASNDWFSASMMQGLSKYERNSKSAPTTGSNVSEMQ